MLVFVYPTPNDLADQVTALAERRGCSMVERPEAADVALAPWLTRILSLEQREAPTLGTLIHHPSFLPFRRGPHSIRWTLAEQDPVTAATWFWADEGLDAGDICEQELLPVTEHLAPRDYYEQVVIPGCLVALGRILDALHHGYVRRVPQNPELATYQSRYVRPPQRPSEGPVGETEQTPVES